jgi:peptide/nickel transport system substrate-binding protein
MMKRRDLLKSTIGALALPSIATAQGARVLRFLPESDVTILDPIWTTATVTRTHGYLVYDTLYAQDASYVVQPQMVEGHTTEEDGRLWRLTLRPGLRFHDGEPVRARDVVPSIRRMAARDAFAAALMEATDELSAVSDRVVQFRLKRPFPLLPAALGKTGTSMPCIMPERLALTDPNKQVSEIVGSGPFRFKPDERVVGARVTYERFADYVPRPDGVASFTAGPKRAFFDRVEWHVIPDPSTKANALTANEADWWDNPPTDLLPLLRGRPGINVAVIDPSLNIGCMRFNTLYPPFDNPAIRRAVLGAIDQTEMVEALASAEPALGRVNVGVFSPGTPMATDEGTGVLVGPRDFARVKAELAKAGYRGERVVVLDPSDQADVHTVAAIGADALRQAGMNVDLVTTDWGTLVQRRASRQPPEQGGWNIFFTFIGGTNNFNPASQLGLRGNGDQAWFGWPKAPKLEALRTEWFAATDLAAQQRICAEMQRQFFLDPTYVPLGGVFTSTAYRGLQGIRAGFAQFYDVQRT